MSQEVAGVASIVKDVERIKKKASDTAASLKHSVHSTDQALDAVKELDDALSAASRDLNAALGIDTNNPPPGQEITPEDPSGGRDEPQEQPQEQPQE